MRRRQSNAPVTAQDLQQLWHEIAHDVKGDEGLWDEGQVREVVGDQACSRFPGFLDLPEDERRQLLATAFPKMKYE